MHLLYYLGVGVALLLWPAKSFGMVTPSTCELINTYTDDRPYRNAIWLTTHNAYANLRDGWFYTQQTGVFSLDTSYLVASTFLG